MRLALIAVLLPLSAALPCDAQTRQVSTRSGIPVQIMGEASWDRNCQSTGGPSYSFNPSPAHGSMSTRPKSKVITTCAAGGCECKGHVVSGPALYYTPERTFKGIDHFGVTSTFPNGVSIEHQAIVTVR